jgi:hypothetical protein
MMPSTASVSSTDGPPQGVAQRITLVAPVDVDNSSPEAIGLPPGEAVGACGPAAAMAFSQVYGRTPTLAEAIELAAQRGWSAAGGMNALAQEKRLLDRMKLPSRLEYSVNWDQVRAEALARQPVLICAPGHYWVVDNFDRETGRYHVGQRGLAYSGGSDWMTPGQMEALAGSPSGALFTQRPMSPVQAHQEVLPPPPVTPAPPPVTAPPAPAGAEGATISVPLSEIAAPQPAPKPRRPDDDE